MLYSVAPEWLARRIHMTADAIYPRLIPQENNNRLIAAKFPFELDSFYENSAYTAVYPSEIEVMCVKTEITSYF